MDRLELFNNFFSEQAGVNLISKFTLANSVYRGKTDIKVKDTKLDFVVEIPDNFPFSNNGFCIKFINPKLDELPHYRCIHTASTANPLEKLKLEIDGLRTWINDYYINKKEDANYEYLQAPYKLIPGNKKIERYLFQDTELSFEKDSFGLFKYSKLGNGVNFILEFFDNNNKLLTQLSWSKNISQILPSYPGFWFFIEKEPIIRTRHVAEKWSELSKFFDYYSKQYLFGIYQAQQKKAPKNKIKPFPILIGYNISDKQKKSIHWEAAYVDLNNFFIKQDFSIRNVENYAFKDKTIVWQKAVNSSYDRFFGRGKLPDEISSKKILVIGIGAIGSNLTKTLVKGGVREMSVCDIDYIEQGNLCRAEYSLPDIGDSKVASLFRQLSLLSPFVNINFLETKKYPQDTVQFSETQKRLEQFDIIFDCTTDNEMALMLDMMNLEAEIFNLSITNKAKELICVTGTNITEKKYHIVNPLDNTPAIFYEGIGCHYPTFEAGYLDISTLLTYAIKTIAFSFKTKTERKSFIIRDNIDKEMRLSKYSIKTFLQKELNLSILISEELLEKINQQSFEEYPKETGGILIGSFFNNNKTLYISEIYKPLKIENTKSSFKRYVDDVNQYLKEKHTDSSGEIVYIGEWHSHPDGLPKYSSKDFNAMKSIAEEPKIQTNNPIMLINGFSPKAEELAIYVYKNNKLYQYEEV